MQLKHLECLSFSAITTLSITRNGRYLVTTPAVKTITEHAVPIRYVTLIRRDSSLEPFHIFNYRQSTTAGGCIRLAILRGKSKGIALKGTRRHILDKDNLCSQGVYPRLLGSICIVRAVLLSWRDDRDAQLLIPSNNYSVNIHNKQPHLCRLQKTEYVSMSSYSYIYIFPNWPIPV